MITSFFKPKSRKGSDNLSQSSFSTPTSTTTSSPNSDNNFTASESSTNDVSGKRRSRDEAGDDDVFRAINDREKKLKKEITRLSPSSPPLPDAVRELVSHLVDDDKQHNNDGQDTNTATSTSWTKQLDRHFRGPSFVRLAIFVSNERKSSTIYPVPSNTFAALNLCPLDHVKVVILGQDPYHGPNQAHGLCFSVEKGQAIPPSLRNIYKELVDDPRIENFVRPQHGCLLRWARQGVLMLNSALTVRKGEPNSHAKKGWEAFTDEVLRIVDQHSRRPNGKGVVFLLWGKPAASKTQGVLQHNRNSQKHTIICTSHPSPLGATKTNQPFLGSRCFSRCNEALTKMGLSPIDWNVDGPL